MERDDMTRRRWTTFLLGATFSAAFAFAAAAQSAPAAPEAPRDGDGRASAAAPVVVADAPGVRLAALIRRGGVLIRNKGVSSVSHPSTGVYCILPTAASGITPSTAIVTLTPEFFYSLYNEIKVQWDSTKSGCPANTIAVFTFADPNANAIYTPSNAVGFSIVVP
jgi:hypothetical protein